MSRSQAGKPVHAAHPNLRGHTDLRFVAPDDLEPCDVLFLALGHGQAARQIERYADLAPRIIDLSADFRLRSSEAYARWYGEEHPAPAWLERFEYGLPEVNREALRGATHVSGVGCNATAMTLALLPLARAGLLGRAVLDLKVGSSEGGARPGASSHHPERSGTVRPYAPTSHRHLAEVHQNLAAVQTAARAAQPVAAGAAAATEAAPARGACWDDSDALDLSVTVHAVEMVRGVACTAHVFLDDWLVEEALGAEALTNGAVAERALWRVFREAYADEPFVRLVAGKSGLHRAPEPKLLAGSNHGDVGFAWDADGRRVVVFSALDNLVKGAAGSAVQCLNLMHGWDEREGLRFPGLHPL